jgi:hypothetical protein
MPLALQGAANRLCLREALPRLSQIARAIGMDLQGAIVSLDDIYDCRANRKAVFNRGMFPNIPENQRGRKSSKRGRKRRFDPAIFKERFGTTDRVLAWEDQIAVCCCASNASVTCTAPKTLAYTMINSRHYC